jgi:hypothetical protein
MTDAASNAPASINAPDARQDCLRSAANLCAMGLPRLVMRIGRDAPHNNAAAAPRFRATRALTDTVKRCAFTFLRWNV